MIKIIKDINIYILFFIMKLSILGLLFLALFLSAALANKEPTKLTYFIEHEEEQD